MEQCWRVHWVTFRVECLGCSNAWCCFVVWWWLQMVSALEAHSAPDLCAGFQRVPLTPVILSCPSIWGLFPTGKVWSCSWPEKQRSSLACLWITGALPLLSIEEQGVGLEEEGNGVALILDTFNHKLGGQSKLKVVLRRDLILICSLQRWEAFSCLREGLN